MSRPKYRVSNGQLEKGVELDDVLMDNVSVPSAIVSAVIPLQPLKASEPIEIRLFPIVNDVNLPQPLKALEPIEVTLSPIVNDDKLLHPLKALEPIDVTLSGMVTDVNPLQPENA